MRITDVRTASLEGNFDWHLVRIYTDIGVTGLGEAYWGPGVCEIIHLIGRDPTDIAKLVEIMTRELSGSGSQAGTAVTAMSGIEIALWDLLGRAHKVPISTFFGGRFRDRIRVYADCHAGDGYTQEADVAKAREVVGAMGYTALKFDLDIPGRLNTDDPDPRRWWYEPYNRTISAAELHAMIDRVAAIREAVGNDTMLMMDCHWKYNVNDAIKLAQALERFNLTWLEDPVPPENIAAHKTVQMATRTPICTGENLYRKHGYRELIETQAVRIISPDIPKMGGLLEFRKVADHADTYFIPIAPHNVSSPIGTVAAAQICAAIQNFLVLEFHGAEVDWWAEVVTGPPPIQNGFIALSDLPGHGLELNEEVARRHLKPGTSFFGETV